MEESKCHGMIIYLSQRFSSMPCFLCAFLHFFISFEYDFHVDADRMMVKTREMYTKEMSTSMVWHDTSLPIFVCYCLLN